MKKVWFSCLICLFFCPRLQADPTLVRVGSKSFTEQVILGEMLAHLLRDAGLRAQHRAELGGTRNLYEALCSGDIDAYVEYTGTLKQNIFAGVSFRSDDEVRRQLARNGVVLGGQLGFTNNYALGVRDEVAKKLNLKTIEDLKNHPKLVIGLSDEFIKRPDGWPALQKRYGLPQQPSALNHEVALRGLASGKLDITDLFSTDAEIRQYNLRVLEDDRGVLAVQPAVILWRADLDTRAPGAVAALRRLEGKISTEAMTELNAKVRTDRLSETVVTGEFLNETLGTQIPLPQSPSRFVQLFWSILSRTWQHGFLVAISLLFAVLVAVPLGVTAYRRPKMGQAILGVVGVIQTIPSMALLVVLVPLLGLGTWTALVALLLYSLLPIVRNTFVGLTQIPEALRESAVVIGLPDKARLWRIELPLASPSIFAGIKTAAVINVGTATIGAIIGAGGYGQSILTGIRLNDWGLILSGAIPAALMALVVQQLFNWTERFFVPQGLLPGETATTTKKASLLGHIFRAVIWRFARLLLSLRYRVRVNGMETIQDLKKKGPVLILPNHPGYMDPALVLSQVGPALDPRPLVYEGTFNNPFMWPFMKAVNALKVPDLESASLSAREVAQTSVQAIIDGLKAGNNHILWPSGRLQRRGVEVLGGARALTDILQAVPDCEIVVVRTRGLWGSMFSFAYTGSLPELSKRILGAVGTIFANLLLFTPRREIRMTIERLDRSQLPQSSREQVNAAFEAWYNAEGPEQPHYVPYHFFFGPREYEYPRLAGLVEVDPSKVKPEVRNEVLAMLSDRLKRPLQPEEQHPHTTLDQIGLDSLDRMELSMHLEQKFGFSTDQVPQTIGQCWALAAGLVEKSPPRPAPKAWFDSVRGIDPTDVLADTLGEAFVARATSCRKEIAIADDLGGCISYERMLLGAMILGRRLVGISAPNVGLMLPASVGGDIAFFALQLAGKLPVVLNWTTGPANLAHAARLMNLTHVLTSRKFLDRSGLKIEGVQFLFMEDLQKEVSRFEALRLLIMIRRFPRRLQAGLPKPDPDSPAVVLFTSGSEKAPKAVPLTHRNLITNIRNAVPSMGFTRQDVMIGFLPTFHSFGLTVTTLAPILCGFRVVHHPDPTDAAGLVRKISGYKVTLLAGTPTFMGYILDRSKSNELESVRLVFVGAERCPDHIFEQCRKLAPTAVVLEGYGITECSPVVAFNSPDAVKRGTVGKPLKGLDTCVLDLDTDSPVEPGRTGMLLVSGPTVFPGYLGHEGESPFRELRGKRWYVTGDLVEQDETGFLHFRGRLKRFLKAGGEMISLPALEEPFTRRYPPNEDGPRIAVEGIETPEGRRIVLFTTVEISLREANALLWEEGFRGVMRLDEVHPMERIPLVGTGKTDYRVLRGMLHATAK